MTNGAPITLERTLAALYYHATGGTGRLSLGQRVVCRLIDGLSMDTLAQREMAARLLRREWDVDLIGRKPRVFLKVGRGGTKSMLAGGFAIDRALGCDVSKLLKREVAPVCVVGPKLKLARPVMGFVESFLDGLKPAVRRRIVRGRITSERVLFYRNVEIQVHAADRGGANLRGKPIPGLVCDEACFFRDADTGVVNDRDIVRAAAPRMREVGGQTLLISSPWTRSGLCYQTWEEDAGRCAKHLVIDVPHPSLLNPVYQEPDIPHDSPEYRVEVLGEWVDEHGDALVSREEVVACQAGRIAEPMPPRRGPWYYDAVDMSGGGTDRTGYAIGHVEAGRVVVDGVWSWDAETLPEDRMQGIAGLQRSYAIRGTTGADQFAFDAYAALGRQYGVTLERDSGNRFSQADRAGKMIRHGQVSLPNDARLRRDLPFFSARHSSGGTTSLRLPSRDAEGGHFDEAQAVILLIDRIEESAKRTTVAIGGQRAGRGVPRPVHTRPVLWQGGGLDAIGR